MMSGQFGWRALAALGACVSLSSASPSHYPHQQPASALYFSRVNPAGGSLVAVGLANDGSLTNITKVFSTGGVGLQTLAGPGIPGNVPNDPLISQGSVVVGDDYVFTVNSGSNTIVMYQIDPYNPVNIRMVGKPVSSLGSYPASLAYSSRYKTLCALNGGVTNGVSCYTVNPQTGLVPDGVGLRNTQLNATTPPIHEGPYPSASDITFSPDSSRLLAVFKGAFEPQMLIAPIFLYDVSKNGVVGTTGANASIPELSFAFGTSWSQKNESILYITDAVYGGILMSLDYNTAKFTIMNTLNNHTEYLGSCWTAYSEAYDTVYDIATLAPNFGAVSATTGNLTRNYSFNSTDGGLDAAVLGSKLYFLYTATNAIGVIDLPTGAVTSNSYFTTADQAYWQGMAIYQGFPGHYRSTRA